MNTTAEKLISQEPSPGALAAAVGGQPRRPEDFPLALQIVLKSRTADWKRAVADAPERDLPPQTQPTIDEVIAGLARVRGDSAFAIPPPGPSTTGGTGPIGATGAAGTAPDELITITDHAGEVLADEPVAALTDAAGPEDFADADDDRVEHIAVQIEAAEQQRLADDYEAEITGTAGGVGAARKQARKQRRKPSKSN